MHINRILLIFVLTILTAGINDLTGRENKSKETYRNRWRIAFSGGMGYRLSSTKESKQAYLNQGFDALEVNNYFKSVKWGPKASAQIHYLFKQKYGIGIDYQFHHSSGSMTGTIDPGDAVTLYYGKIHDNIYTNYTGLSFYSNEWLIQNKLNFYAQTSMGLTLFRQENMSLYTPALITGKALGVNLETGLEYFVYKNVALGIHLNYFQSTISKIKVDDGNSTNTVELDKKQHEGLGRLDGGAGVKFYF